MRKSALYLWCAGLAIVTFDLVLTFGVGGFTVKSYYFLFLAAAGLFYLSEPRPWDSVRELAARPWVFAFLLFLYDIGMSPFSFAPKKSFAYACWLLFDLVVVALPGAALLRAPAAKKALFPALVLAAFFLVGILLVDFVAFQYGYTAGFIGFNQEQSLGWGMSRAHAFSYEPSYLSLYFTFSLFLFTGELLSPAPVLKRRLLLAASAALVIGILLLTSRTGWLLTALGLAAILARFHRVVFRRRGLTALAAVALAVGVFLAVLPSHHLGLIRKNLVHTLATGTDGSSNSRMRAMKDGVRIGLESRGLGVGLGASFFYYIHQHPEAITPRLQVSMRSEYIMSTWGQLFAESGFPGSILYLCFGLAVTWALARKRYGPDESTVYACGVSAALFFLLAAHLVGNVARTDVWVWFAIWAAYARPPRAA